jgi:hypothetical protein
MGRKGGKEEKVRFLDSDARLSNSTGKGGQERGCMPSLLVVFRRFCFRRELSGNLVGGRVAFFLLFLRRARGGAGVAVASTAREVFLNAS